MSQPVRILLLEDSAVDAELNLRELGRAGFDPQWTRVETEADYLAALHPPPDLILADYSLPQFDGLSALKRLREQQLEIPFILVSGVMGEEKAVAAMKLGATDYLLKDRLARLGDAVKNALEEKQLRDAKRQAEESLRETNIRLQTANEKLRDARLAALNLMEDALLARQQTEQLAATLKASEHRIQQALQVSHSYAFEWHPAADTVLRSASCGAIFGLTGDAAIHDTGKEFFQRVHPDDRERFLQRIQTLTPEAASYSIEYRLRHTDGRVMMLEEIGQAGFDAAGQLEKIVGVTTDITQRKQAEEKLHRLNRTLKVLNASDRALIHAKDEAAYLREICRIIIEHCGYVMVWVGFAEPDEARSVRPAASAGFEKGYLDKLKITWAETAARGRGPTGTAIRTGQVCQCRDLRTDPRVTPWRKEAVQRGYASSIAMPLLADGQAFGALTIYNREVGGFDAEEVQLLTELCGDFAFGITTLRLRTAHAAAEQALREAHDKLEQRVRERTAQLTRSNTALLAEKAFSDSLIELAPAVIAMVDMRGNLIRANAYAEQLTGYPFAETKDRNMIELLVPRNEQSHVRRLVREILRGRVVRQVVTPLHIRNGSMRIIEWFAKPLANAAGKLSAVLAIGQDITERTQAEMSLRRSEQNLAVFFNQAPIGLLWLSTGGIIVRTNQAQLDLTGHTAEEYLGQSFIKLGGDKVQGTELLRRLAAKETVRNFPMSWRCRDGTVRHVLVDANSFWRDTQFQYSSIFLRDITDRVKLEREVLQAGEQEHRRIGQDLHDGLGQVLAGAAYLSGTLRKDLAAKSLPEARQIRRIHEVINEAIVQTRSLARGLHPVEAEPNGLMVALAALAARTKKLFHTGCRFNCPRPVLIQDNAVATHLFRIAQEAVTNAIKHGKPSRIEISLARTSGQVSLAVKNNGTGMAARPKKPGVGLRIMRYRAGMIGGTLAIQKVARGGTAVICTLHLSGTGGMFARPQTATSGKKGLKRKRKN